MRTSVFLAVFVGLAACGRMDVASEYEAARAAFGDGDLQTAAIHLSNVIQQDPSHGAARALRGRVAARFGDFAAAAKEFESAVSAGVPLEELRFDFADAAARSGNGGVARELLATGAAGDGMALRRAEVLLTLGDLDAAGRELQEAERVDPDQQRLLVAKARFALLNGNPAAAEELASQALAAGSENPEALLVRAEAYSRSGRFERAVQDLRQAADVFARQQRTAREVPVLFALVQLHLAGNDIDAATVVGDRLAERATDAAVVAYVRGLLEYRRGRFDRAAAEIQRALGRQPDNPMFSTLLAATQLALGNLGQAEQNLLKVLAVTPRDPAASKLLAETRLRQQRPLAALEALQALSGGTADDAEIGFLAGLANIRAGNTEEGVLYLEQAAALDPTNTLLKLELAKAYVAAGRDADAQRLFQSGFDASDSAEVGARLLELLTYARTGDRAAAEAVVERLLQDERAGASALTVAAAYYQAAGNEARAFEVVTRAVTEHPTAAAPRLLLASLLMRQGRLDEAEVALNAVRASDPAHVDAAMGLARIAAFRGDTASAEAFLRDVTDRSGSLAPRLMLAQLLIAGGRLDDAELELTAAARSAPDAAEVVALRGVIALARGDSRSAARLLADANERIPNRLSITLALAQAELANGNGAGAVETLQTMLDRVPNSVPLRAALGTVHLRNGNADAASAIAKALQSEFPSQTQGYVLQGQIDIASRRFDAAAKTLRVAYSLEPSWPLLMRTVSALELAGDPAAGADLLEEWIETRGSDTRARFALASLLQANGQAAAAVAQYEHVLRADPRNVVALNNAAWLYHELGDGRALALAESASALAPDNPAVLDTLGSILLSQNREQEALVQLQKAAQLAPDSADIRYHLAQAQVRLRLVGDARATLEALLRDNRSFDSRDSAEALLKSL